MWNGITSKLEHYMDLLSTRQQIVASNIANADTPGYKTQDVDFHFELMSQMEDAAVTPPRVVEVDGLTARNDGNNVSLDRESRMLSENALRFAVTTQLWKSQLRQIRSAIQEGKNG
jgi:flagellar basal-body rod protein FlgB